MTDIYTHQGDRYVPTLERALLHAIDGKSILVWVRYARDIRLVVQEMWERWPELFDQAEVRSGTGRLTFPSGGIIRIIPVSNRKAALGLHPDYEY